MRYNQGLNGSALRLTNFISFLSYKKFERFRSDKIRKRKRQIPSNMTLGQIAGSLDDAPQPEINVKEEARVCALEDSFALCRVIGNDLSPRHVKGQSLQNLKFILENEGHLQDCKKLWLLNRVFDPETENSLVALLNKHNQEFRKIPFDIGKLNRAGFDFSTLADPMLLVDGRLAELDPKVCSHLLTQTYRSKNNCLVANNDARNVAIEWCHETAKWALPFDGNCFFSQDAWCTFRRQVLDDRSKRYFTVPMVRMRENASLLNDAFLPEPDAEPQLAFRCDAPLRFDQAHPYSRRDKAELLLHLGVSGPWQGWRIQFFDLAPRRVSPEGHRVGQAGWVARLSSGKEQFDAEGARVSCKRDQATIASLCFTLDMLEAREVNEALSRTPCVVYSPELISSLSKNRECKLFCDICAEAERVLEKGQFSVTPNFQIPRSGDTNDNFHPRPTLWPALQRIKLPYLRLKRHRVSETLRFETKNSVFEQTALKCMFDDTTTLAIAALLTGNDAYRIQAKAIIRAWFIEPSTRLNPHLEFVHDLVETIGFYYFLDAVRMLKDDDLAAGVTLWVGEFLTWLEKSEQGIAASKRGDHYGTCYDLLCAALSAFLNDTKRLQEVNFRAQSRLAGSIAEDGQWNRELIGTVTQSICVYNLQCWVSLFDLLESAGFYPWNSASANRLLAAMRHVLRDSGRDWKKNEIERFRSGRMAPINHNLRLRRGEVSLPLNPEDSTCISYWGLAPYWSLTHNFARPKSISK